MQSWNKFIHQLNPDKSKTARISASMESMYKLKKNAQLFLQVKIL